MSDAGNRCHRDAMDWTLRGAYNRQTSARDPTSEQRESIVPELYDRNGLRFAYPENWTVEDDEQSNADASATVNSPNSAFWSVMLYREQMDVRELAKCVLDALKTEYPQIEVDQLDTTFQGEQVYGYDLSFTYLDLLNTASIRAFHYMGRTYLILSQAEDGELQEVEPVFQAMTASLTRETTST